MPARSDIEPTELRGFLQMVMLIDVVDDPRRYVYRLVGTKEVEGRGRDPTGQSVAQASYGNSNDAISFYDTIISNKLPALFSGEYAPRPGRFTKEQIIGLPLANDGDTVNMIVVFSVTEWLKEVRPDFELD